MIYAQSVVGATAPPISSSYCSHIAAKGKVLESSGSVGKGLIKVLGLVALQRGIFDTEYPNFELHSASFPQWLSLT
jgi:hypothetical protein